MTLHHPFTMEGSITIKYMIYLLDNLSLTSPNRNNAYINKNICSIKTKIIRKESNSTEDFIEGLIVFIQLFVAEIYTSYVFANVSI